MKDSMVFSRIVEAFSAAGALYHRLILVVGPPGSGKTSSLYQVCEAQGWKIINLNLHLSERLLELTKRQRAISVSRLVAEIVASVGGDTVALDNVELLFDRELALDPLRLLQGMSRDRTLIVAWPGETDGTNLTYAQPGHPEARRYDRPDAILVTTGEPRPNHSQEKA